LWSGQVRFALNRARQSNRAAVVARHTRRVPKPPEHTSQRRRAPREIRALAVGFGLGLAGLIGVLAGCALAAPGAVVVPSGANPTNASDAGTVSLTFDDGPGRLTTAVLDVLADHNVSAVFYVVGDQIEAHADEVARIVADGHEIANHSWSHPNLTTLTRAEILEELSTTSVAIERATGVLVTRFRPPFGMYDDVVRSVAADLGLSVDLWDINTHDWNELTTADQIVEDTMAQVFDGAVVLFHVNHPATVEALPRLIAALREAGFTV
jgi:peptidoglycan/xylan/chitin deacetylase (PgdA/CDA1 family)